eukprot:11618964-Alexandrium_andersonii.AAC.1
MLSRAPSLAPSGLSLATAEDAQLRAASVTSRGMLTVPPILTLAFLQHSAPSVRKQMLGEQLHPMVEQLEPQRAGKITGMMLELSDE